MPTEQSNTEKCIGLKEAIPDDDDERVFKMQTHLNRSACFLSPMFALDLWLNIFFIQYHQHSQKLMTFSTAKKNIGKNMNQTIDPLQILPSTHENDYERKIV